jgi:integrase
MSKLEKLPSGTWRTRVYVEGKQVSVTGADRKSCLAKAAALLSGTVKPGDSITLSKAIDRYIKNRENVLSPSTIRGYRTIQKSRFQGLMDRKIPSITASQWTAAVNQEAKLCSAKTLKNAWRFIASVVKDSGNTVPRVTLPQVIPAEKAFLEPEQIPDFIQAVHGTPVEIPALLALHGLRRSELLALTWDTVDTKNAVLHVSGAVVQDEDNAYVHKKENKNVTSHRDVPIIIPELTAALIAADHSRPVVQYAPNSIRTAINRVCQLNGLPKVGVHGLRHSFASLCYHLDVPEKVVMELGGWKDDHTMRRIYTHLAQKDRDSNVLELRNFFDTRHKTRHENGQAIGNTSG